MKSVLLLLVILLGGFSAALLLSPSFYDSVRDLISEQTEDLSLEGLSETLEGISLSGDSSLALEWTGFEDFSGDVLYVVLEPESESSTKLGPFEATIGDDGVVNMTFHEGYSDGNWKIYSYVDGNGNGTCDEADADVKQESDVFPGLVERSIGWLEGFAAPEGVCGHFTAAN